MNRKSCARGAALAAVSSLLCVQTSWAQLAFTNIVAGGAFTNESGITFQPAPDAGSLAGVTFDNGIGDGTYAGAGSLSVINVGSATNEGFETVIGLAGNEITQLNGGGITVMNDRSAASNVLPFARAVGVLARSDGSLSDLNVSAYGGEAFSTNGADASGAAFGLIGALEGDLTDVRLVSIAGTANGTDQAEANAIAMVSGEGVSGTISGVFVDALAGTAASSNGLADASAVAWGAMTRALWMESTR